VIEPQTGQEVFREPSADSMGCASFDGRQIASYAPEGTQLWDLPSRTVATLMCGAPITFSPDGRKLLCHTTPIGPFSDTMELAVWDTETWSESFRFQTVTQLNRMQARFSRDGKTLIASCLDMKDCPQVWDLESKLKKNALSFKSWAPVQNDTILAGLGKDGSDNTCLRFWDIATGRDLHVIPLPVDDRWQGIDSDSLRVSANGRLLAFSTATETPPRVLPPQLPQWSWLRRAWERGTTKLEVIAEVTLLDVATKRKIGSIGGLADRAVYAFSPDGSLLASLQDRGEITVWEVPPRKPIWLVLGVSCLFLFAVSAARFAYHRLRRTAV
jgi:WD40 repeat protein